MESIDSYIGGIDIPAENDTIVYGSGKFTRVVNYQAKFNSLDRLLKYKHSKKNDVKKMLRIIGLSIPITFDTKVYYDDQGSKKYDDHKSVGNEDKVITMLKMRLSMSIKNLIQLKIYEYKLKESPQIALAELIAYLARFIKRKNKHSNMRKIKISYSVSNMLDHISDGKKLFTIIAVNDEDTPSNLSEVVLYMIEKLEKQQIKMGNWPEDMQLNVPKFPQLDKKIIAKIGKVRKLKMVKCRKANIQNMVYAILMIDHILLPYLTSVESYYNQLAKDVQTIHKTLTKFLNSG